MPLPATIEECHVLIAQLVSTVSALTSQVEILKLEITQLKEKLNQNSNNGGFNYLMQRPINIIARAPA